MEYARAAAGKTWAAIASSSSGRPAVATTRITASLAAPLAYGRHAETRRYVHEYIYIYMNNLYLGQVHYRAGSLQAHLSNLRHVGSVGREHYPDVFFSFSRDAQNTENPWSIPTYRFREN